MGLPFDLERLLSASERPKPIGDRLRTLHWHLIIGSTHAAGGANSTIGEALLIASSKHPKGLSDFFAIISNAPYTIFAQWFSFHPASHN